MTNPRPPVQPSAERLERALRDACNALDSIVDDSRRSRARLDDLPANDLLAEFERAVAETRMVWARDLGPPIAWETQRASQDPDWGFQIYCMDLDLAEQGDAASVFLTHDLAEGFRESAFGKAALAYKREARWDFSPDEAGVWLIALQPLSWATTGDSEEPVYPMGNLVGVLIVHDRDEDGEYESIAHVWTAALWRRRGIASILLREARARFPIRVIEGPATKLGAALITARAPDL
jgi:ribosomal protein S18 acetylase RimI-like enzyme